MTQTELSQQQIQDLVAETARLRQERQWAEQIEAFVQAVHGSLHPTETAYAIANDGRRLIGCDRLSVVVRHGFQARLEAMSGQELINRRANSVRLLERLCFLALASDDRLWYPDPAGNVPPQIEDALQAYLDQAQAKSLLVVPLLAPHQADDQDARPAPGARLGGLVIEQFSGAVDQPMCGRAEAVGRGSSVALRNALQHNRIFLLPLWSALGNVSASSARRSTTKRLVVAVCLLAIALAVYFIPARFTLTASGTLQPQEKRHVFAGADGVVSQLMVQEGAEVAKDEILLELRNSELDLKLEEVVGQLQTTGKKLAAMNASRLDSVARGDRDQTHLNQLAGEEEELRGWLKSLQQQHAILTRQKADLNVRSPLEGEVITWSLRETLAARPVRRGQRLMTVANLDGSWNLELLLADRRAGHLLSAQQRLRSDLEVSFILATDPNREVAGRITEVAKSTKVDEDHGQSILVTVSFDRQEVEFLRPGAGATAKIFVAVVRSAMSGFTNFMNSSKSQVVFRFS